MFANNSHFAGNFTTRLQFERIPLGTPTDSHGQIGQSWSPAFPPVWGALRSPRGAESQMALAEVGYRMTSIELNYRPADDIDIGMRAIVVGSQPERVLEVMSPAMDVTGLQRFVVVLAREKLNQG